MKGSIDPVWEEIHSTQEWGQYPSEHVIRFVARNYYKKDRRSVKILDFGGGGGAHTWYLAREGFDVYGFDGSPSAVRKAEAKLAREHLSAHLCCATGQDVSYEDDFFDAVIDNVTSYANYQNDIIVMYAKMLRFLKPGGKILTSVFGRNTTGYGCGRKVEEDTFTDMQEGNLAGRGVCHFYTKDTLTGTLQKVGFRNVCCDTCTYTDGDSVVELLLATGEK